MRKLMWFTIGFGASCAVGAYFFSGNVLVVLALTVLLLAFAALLAGKSRDLMKPVSVACFGLAAGFLWFWGFDAWYLAPARELDGVATQASLEITDYCFENEYGYVTDAVASWQGKTYRLRVYLDDEAGPGDIVSGSFRFRITDAGGEKNATYHRGEGIVLIATPIGETVLDEAAPAWWEYPAAFLRQRMLDLVDDLFPEDTQSFARALLLGDDSGIGYETNTAFKVSGIRHIIAISGLHVSILFACVYVLSGKNRIVTALAAIPVLVLFAAVAGFTPSVTRACIMCGLMILAMLFNKEYDPPTALAFAALAMLVVNPLVITSVGFQLSVGSMAGIFLFAAKIQNWLLDDKRLGGAKGKSLKARLIRGFAGSVSVSLGAVSLTTPLCALYFGTVSLISPLSNLLLLPVVTFAFYGIMAACLVGALWPGAGTAIAWLVSWPIRLILGTADLLARLPLAAVYTESGWITLWLVFCYLLLSVFLLMKHKRPLIFGCAAVLSLCAALLASWIPAMTDSCRVTVLDVGQGQSIILQSGGRTFVVDCGGDYADDAADKTAETLLSMGISRIDGLILTHYDGDHAGGAVYLLSRIHTDALFLPDMESDSALDLKGYDNAWIVGEDLCLETGNIRLTLIPSEIADSGNESSLCVLFQAEDCDILITGDRGTLGEKLLMQNVDLPELEVLIVGHHGSASSTGTALLEQTHPQIAVISVGENNYYGHPSQEVLDRLKDAGCTVYRTDRDGTVIIRR